MKVNWRKGQAPLEALVPLETVLSAASARSVLDPKPSRIGEPPGRPTPSRRTRIIQELLTIILYPQTRVMISISPHNGRLVGSGSGSLTGSLRGEI